jgi:enoyl-CoA hydratase/carnithine racemase
MTGRTIGAPRAFELGLIQNPVARGEATLTALRMARQAAQFAPQAMRAAKSLTKALPEGALAREKATFVELFAHPTVRAALSRFATSTDVRPYL